MIFAIIAARLTAFFLHLFKKGATTLPGKIALKIKPNLLCRLSQGVHILCVTGTNGKTTTCALLEHAFRQTKHSYFINKSGANMISGVATAFLMNSTWRGKCRKEYAILECDENSLPAMAHYLDADILLVTNLFRDQLDRYGEISTTQAAIQKAILQMPNCTLLLNADCPLTYTLSLHCQNRIKTFGIQGNFEHGTALSDSRYCPLCSSVLQYRSRNYAQLGNYRCPRCQFARPAPDYMVSNIISGNIATSFIFTAAGTQQLASTALGGIYNLYNMAAAGAMLAEGGIADIALLSDFTGAFGRMERFTHRGQTILLLLVKNPVGLTECLRYVSRIKSATDIAFALNDNEADGRDISWIWDCDFTPLQRRNPCICTIGTRAYDMALRLKYDEIMPTCIIDGEDYGTLLTHIAQSGKDYIIFSTYTAMMHMRPLFIERFGGKEFWE